MSGILLAGHLEDLYGKLVRIINLGMKGLIRDLKFACLRQNSFSSWVTKMSWSSAACKWCDFIQWVLVLWQSSSWLSMLLMYVLPLLLFLVHIWVLALHLFFRLVISWLGNNYCLLIPTEGDHSCQLDWKMELNSYCLLFDTGVLLEPNPFKYQCVGGSWPFIKSLLPGEENCPCPAFQS